MADDRTGLDQGTRDALTHELFAGLQALEPDKFHCFCGGDADLIDAVQDVRGRLADREPGDDR